MVKKLALASLFFAGNDATASLSCSPPPSMSAASSSTAASWQWPSCGQARTASFDGRSSVEAEAASSSARRDCCRTRVITNPAYCDDTADSSFVSATASSSASTAAPEPELSRAREAEDEEAVIRGIRASSRLFFEPEATKSIVTTSKPADRAAFGGATALAIDSADPYGDFRRSMEEMVLSRGGAGEDDWGWLEEMLGWYLRANGKNTHGLIVGAFVDLLVGLSAVNSKQSGQC